MTGCPSAGSRLKTRLRGRFNVENVLAAVAAGRLLGLAGRGDRTTGSSRSRESRAGSRPSTRASRSRLSSTTRTSLDALENVLRTARELTSGQLICVFGCGGDRDRGKRPLMGRIAADLADVAIVTSDNPRSEDPLAIIDEIVAGMAAEPEVEPDRRRAIALAARAGGAGRRGRDRRQRPRARPGDRRPSCCRSTTARSRAKRFARCEPHCDPALARRGPGARAGPARGRPGWRTR